MKSESKIETAVCKYAKENGFYVRKFSSPSNRGVPDRIFISPCGKWFCIEFKAPKKKATALQEREIKLIEKNSGKCYVVDDYTQGKDIIDAHIHF